MFTKLLTTNHFIALGVAWAGSLWASYSYGQKNPKKHSFLDIPP
jgi:hypothetical protein